MAENYTIIKPLKPGTYESKRFQKSEDKENMYYVVTEEGMLTYDTGENVAFGEGWTNWVEDLGPFRLVEEPKPREPKAHTTTRIKARLNWEGIEKIVDITSGRAAVSLSVRPNPSEYGDTTGTTNLTPDQAEQLAKDILERVAEIRTNEEAGA